MQFDPWAFEPPLGEFFGLIDWLSLAGCVFGWVTCIGMILGRSATPADYTVWRRALLGGAVVGAAALLAVVTTRETDVFTALLFRWTLFSALGAGAYVSWASRERHHLGLLVVQAVAVFALGVLAVFCLAAAALSLQRAWRAA